MARPKNDGRGRLGGRAKGVPNKATRDLFEICEKHGVDVFEAMVISAKATDDPVDKFKMLSEIAQYLYPKRKAVEISGKDGKPIESEIKFVCDERLKYLDKNREEE